MKAVGTLREFGAAAAELAFGSVCAGCGTEPGLICAACREELHGPQAVVRPSPSGSVPVAAAASYAGAVREIILAHKERGRLGLARPLGEAVAVAVATLLDVPRLDGGSAGADAVRDGDARPVRQADAGDQSSSAGDRPLVLVPVPSSRPAVRKRGHDAVTRMTRHAARLLRRGGMDCSVVPALRHQRRVVDQSGLSATERAANLAGALTVRRGTGELLAGGGVIVVDDIVTTGATLGEAERVLRGSGHAPAGAAVVASA